jgi:hypothetical protein
VVVGLEKFVECILTKACGQSSFFGKQGRLFFVRAKVTVRAKRVRVNSVFLVQVRKNQGGDFPDWEG